MSSLIDLLKEAPPRLIFSPPRNDPELVRAALAAGAEAIKVHIHARHQASGTGFGDVLMEGPAIERIRALSDVPVGVVVGDGSAMATRGELKRLAEIGVDFIDAYNAAWSAVNGVDVIGTFDRKHYQRLDVPPATAPGTV